MGAADAAYLMLRLPMVGLCAWASLAAQRQAATYSSQPDRRLRSQLGAALMALLAVIALANAIEEGVRRSGQPIRALDWVWLPVDLLLPLFFLWMLKAMAERDALERRLARAAEHDPLTGLPNRAGFARRVAASLSAPAAGRQPSVAVMLDIDHFKAVNDGWGHAAGDAVLREVAATARAALREQDALGRMGGEEFALVLPGLTPEEALSAVDRLRGRVTEEVPHPGGGARRLTLSAGIAPIAGASTAEVEQALAVADAALYAAKAAGRDRSVVSLPG